MKKLLLFSLFIFIVACSKDDDGNFVAPIAHSFTITFDENYENLNAEGALITLVNKEDGKTYTGTSDTNGIVSLEVIPGVYNVNVSLRFSSEDYLEFSGLESEGDVNFNASMESISISAKSETSTEITLVTGRIGNLLIKQVYYAGSDVRLGALYRDQFFEIHNNSNETIYLDGIYFAQIYGEASTRSMPRNLYLSREELIGVIGEQAEKIVYEFSSIPAPRSENIRLYPTGQLREDLILLDKANKNEIEKK